MKLINLGEPKRLVTIIPGTIVVLTLLMLVAQPISISILTSSMNKYTSNSGISEINTGSYEELQKKIISLDKQLEDKIPRGYYLVVNSSANRFYLYKGKEVIKGGQCSTGSYILLKNSDQQQWMFKTPKGEFKIRSKTVAPVWKKPDWAFVEAGLPVPSANHSSRFEYGVLGEYSLGIGDGYLIHGTLYQRFLGLPVTHGCIRLNDENLELVFKSLSIGSKVYIL